MFSLSLAPSDPVRIQHQPQPLHLLQLLESPEARNFLAHDAQMRYEIRRPDPLRLLPTALHFDHSNRLLTLSTSSILTSQSIFLDSFESNLILMKDLAAPKWTQWLVAYQISSIVITITVRSHEGTHLSMQTKSSASLYPNSICLGFHTPLMQSDLNPTNQIGSPLSLFSLPLLRLQNTFFQRSLLNFTPKITLSHQPGRHSPLIVSFQYDLSGMGALFSEKALLNAISSSNCFWEYRQYRFISSSEQTDLLSNPQTHPYFRR